MTRLKATLTFASWNRIAAWLRQLERLPQPVRRGGASSEMDLMYAQESSACAPASLRRLSRKPHVVLREHGKKERL